MSDMKLEGRISLLVGAEYTTIEIEDHNASTRFVRIKLTPEQLSKCLSRQALVECEIEVSGLNKVGKVHENKNFTFEIPDNLRGSSNSDELSQICQHLLDENNEGWVCDGYFGSKNSFFEKNGKVYARAVIRRWV